MDAIYAPDNLLAKFDEPVLSNDKVVEGLYECYIIANRAILSHYQSDVDPLEMDADVEALVGEILEVREVQADSLDRNAMKAIIEVLDGRFGLNQFPDIYEAHRARITELVRRMPSVTLL